MHLETGPDTDRYQALTSAQENPCPQDIEEQEEWQMAKEAGEEPTAARQDARAGTD